MEARNLVAMEEGKFGILKEEMMNVFYYYYYQFYLKILKDNEPHMLTTLALSASEAFLINGIIDFIALKFFCFEISKWLMISIVILLLGVNYGIYHKTGLAQRILKEKPQFLNNKNLSIVLTLLFFLATLSWLFLAPIYGKHLLSQCN